MAGRGTPATDAARRAGVPHTLHEVPAAGAGRGPVGHGMAAAAAMGVDPARVLKTLVAEVDGRPTLGVVPVDRSLDLKALAAAAGGKRAELAGPERAERATGYVVGGISPLGQRRRLPAVVDASALDHPTVFVSGGRRGLEVELAPADLVRLAGAVVAPIAR
ncbi:MAG: aminoacyl-tRNA deacylase [Acidimicrobiales bacterium]|nr:aminoacyl-tRNA deacylase [Acidimicrobiales bacterium]